MSFIGAIQAEFIKLKYAPILWLCGFVVFTVLAIIFAAHFIDVNSVATLGDNPWSKIAYAGQGILAVFIIIPFVILFISSAVFIEHQSNAWKHQYTIPKSRSFVFYAKLISQLLIIMLVLVILLFGLTICGYLLDQFLPEMEFRYYTPPFWTFVKSYSHTFIATLGVIGIHYFLSLRFKGFLVPASLGVIAFIVGIILGSINNPMALYYPYSYPIVANDVGMFNTDKIGIVEYAYLNNVQLYSIACFVFFVGLANILEIKKRIV